METINPEEMLTRLQSEFKYPAKGAQLVAGKLAAARPEIQAAFLHWWNTGELTPIEAEGYTWEGLMKDHGLNPIGALLTLDWLIREPEKALPTVRRGHDRVG